MVKVAAYVVAAAGLNATNTLQDAEGARVAPQVFNSTKSVGLAPASPIELIVTVDVPVFVTVTVVAADVVPCRVVGNGMLPGLTVSVGTPVPLPVSVTMCGEPAALSVTLTVAESEPVPAGLKAT
jgi:hypothetical protein